MSLAMFILIPLLIRALGGTELTIGLVLGVSTAASVATRPLVGMLLDRIGRRPVLLMAGAVNACSWLPFLRLRPAGARLYVWGPLPAIVWGALFASYFTYAADLTPPGRRAEGIAVFGVFGMTANGLGPMLGERIIAGAGFPAYLLTAVCFALVSVALTTLVPARPPVLRAVDAVPHMGLRALMHAAANPGLPLVLAVTVVLGIAINAAFFFVAPYTRDVGLERSGSFFAAYSATSVVIRLFGRRALDALGPHLARIPRSPGSGSGPPARAWRARALRHRVRGGARHALPGAERAGDQPRAGTAPGDGRQPAHRRARLRRRRRHAAVRLPRRIRRLAADVRLHRPGLPKRR